MNKTTEHRSLAAIIVLGCLLRLAYALWVPNEFPVWTDSQNYLSIARNVATDFSYANSWQPPRNMPRFGDIGLTSYREPIYPLFLGVQLKLFGDSPRTIFIIQALLGTLTVPLCFGVAAMLLSSRTALLAALFESVNPYHIYHTAFVSTETITTIILLGLVFFALRVLRAIDDGRGISRSDLLLLVFFLSTGVLTRAVFAPIALVTLVFIGTAQYRRSAAMAPTARTVGLFGLLTMVGVSPWFIRNYLVWDTFVYQTNAGHNLVMGYNDLATGGYGHTKILELDRALEPHGHNEVKRDSIFKQEAFKWIRSHPIKAIYLFVKKQVIFWSPVPDVVKGHTKQLGIAWGIVFLSFTVIGLVRARSDQLALKYVWAIIIVYSLVHSVVLAVTRYRIPLEGVLAVFAGCGLDSLLRAPFQLKSSR